MPLYSDNNYFTQIKIDQVTNPDHCLLCHMIEFSECYHTIYVVRFFHSIIAMPMPFCFNKTGGIFFLWVELNSLNNITPFRCGLNCASVLCVHDFSFFFFFFFVQPAIVDKSIVNSASVHCSRVPQITLFRNFFIKNRSHSPIYAFKNYFA